MYQNRIRHLMVSLGILMLPTLLFIAILSMYFFPWENIWLRFTHFWRAGNLNHRLFKFIVATIRSALTPLIKLYFPISFRSERAFFGFLNFKH
jgi:hypothetical protein